MGYWRDIYWFGHDLLFPQNVIRIRSLKRGYSEVDVKLEEVMVQLFCDFIEVEKPFEHFVTIGTPQEEMWFEMKALYRFWKEEAPKLKQELKDILKAKNRLAGLKREDEIHEIFTEKLCAIVKLRFHLWT